MVASMRSTVIMTSNVTEDETPLSPPADNNSKLSEVAVINPGCILSPGDSQQQEQEQEQEQQEKQQQQQQQPEIQCQNVTDETLSEMSCSVTDVDVSNECNDVKVKKKKRTVRICEDVVDISDTCNSVIEPDDPEEVWCSALPKVKSHGNATVKQAIAPKVKVTVTDTSSSHDPTANTAKKIVRTISSTDSFSSKPTGKWPLKRSQSVDSRDNPFLPGGDLEKEADDLLSRATIIRDQFFLRDNGTAGSPTKSKSPDEESALPVDEYVSPEVAKTAESGLENAKPKENGKLDSEDSLSPGSVKMDLTETNKDKKKQKKCCVLM